MKEQELKNTLNKINISEEMQNRILEKTKNYGKDNAYMKFNKKIILVTIAATFILCITVFATVINWSNGFLSGLNISKNQMNTLQNSQQELINMPFVSDTHNGITVSTAQCLFDGNSIRMSFYVEGYELDNTIEPKLNSINILIDDKPVNNYFWEFFNGIDNTNKNNPVMADGTPVKEDKEGGYIPNYRIADGKMEIDVELTPFDENGKALTENELKNKKITVNMEDFGNTKGIWTLEWNLNGLEKGKELLINKELGNSGAKVISADIYASSAVIKYNFPKTEIKDYAYDENNNLVYTTDYAQPPIFIGVRLNDGTLYTDLQNGGSSGYEDINTDEFVARINFSRIIEVDKIQGLLFLKDINNDAENITLDDCYIIDVDI